MRTPRLFVSDRSRDFGPGFYLTSSHGQAALWARLVSRRRDTCSPHISVYEYHTPDPSDLRILRFDEATFEWLSFVGANRRGEKTDAYDMVQGPVPDINTMPALKLYFAGVYSEEEAIKRLVPQKPSVQYAFKTEKALGLLTLSEVILV